MKGYAKAIKNADNFIANYKRRNGEESYSKLLSYMYGGALTATEKDEILVVSRMSQRKG